MEIVEILFTVKGPTAGAILIEYVIPSLIPNLSLQMFCDVLLFFRHVSRGKRSVTLFYLLPLS
jgi:hypothetical protein